jgi:ABC-2 type transport system permease protein
VRDQLRVLKHTAIGAFAEYRAFYTWQSWLVGWLLRLLMQASFYALVGRLLGSQQQVEYLVVGNAVYIVAMEACIVVLATVSERRAGTLPLMVAAPATHLTVYLGRGVHYLTSGLLTSSIALFTLPPLFGITLPMPQALLALPMIVLIGLAAYGYGAAVSCLVLHKPGRRWTAMNLSYLVLLAFAGVNVPTGFWPGPVQAVAQVLPLTHGLTAVRTLLDGGPAAEIAAQLALEAAVGAGWFVVAALGFARVVRVGRARGTLELAA